MVAPRPLEKLLQSLQEYGPTAFTQITSPLKNDILLTQFSTTSPDSPPRVLPISIIQFVYLPVISVISGEHSETMYGSVIRCFSLLRRADHSLQAMTCSTVSVSGFTAAYGSTSGRNQVRLESVCSTPLCIEHHWTCWTCCGHERAHGEKRPRQRKTALGWVERAHGEKIPRQKRTALGWVESGRA